MTLPAAAPEREGRALSADQFDMLMQACGPFAEHPKLAVAVSGGPDSIALTFLLHEWVMTRGGSLLALTVDHQLRTDSSREASDVKAWCAARSISHETLVWEKDATPVSAIHQRARTARYDLLLTACAQHGITDLCVGHHANDQAETVLMRFLKGSGMDGLAAMPVTRNMRGARLLRPFLPVTKERLEVTCAQRGWAFFRDPSNHSESFARTRIRKLAGELEQEGYTTQKMVELARSAGLARAALEQQTNEWQQKHASVDAFGIIDMGRGEWRNLSDDMKRRTLIRALLCMSGEDYPPKAASMDHLVGLVKSTGNHHVTLSGCHVMAIDDRITLFREFAAVAPAQPFQHNMLWDARFQLRIVDELRGTACEVRPLGDISRDKLEKMGHKTVAACPALHRSTLPALFVDNQLVHIPEFTGHTAGTRQTLVKAIFSPQRMLIIDCFDVAMPLMD